MKIRQIVDVPGVGRMTRTVIWQRGERVAHVRYRFLKRES